MPKKKKTEGFHSAAGLIRYFDQEDDKALKIPPWLVVGMAIATAVVVEVARHIY
ncbi:MAG: preprotein translocase subunit Sec61beta [Thermoplasmata archaeon]